jgi:hypothetical protein
VGDAEGVMIGFPVPAHLRVTAAKAYDQPSVRWFMQHVREVVGTASVGAGGERVAELATAPRDLGGVHVDGVNGGLDAALSRTQTDAFIVLHCGVVVDERYFNGMTAETQHLWQSVSKSLVSCVAGNLVASGDIDPDESIVTYVPELRGSAYGDARLRHLLDMQVGIDFSEDYDDPESEVARLDRLYGFRAPTAPDEPGSTYEFAMSTAKKGEHGERLAYVSLNTNVLGWVMERATGLRLSELIRREVWSKLGAEHEAYIALDGAGSAQAEGGFCSSLRDLARFGQAICDDGRFNGHQVVPRAWAEDIRIGGDRAAYAREYGSGGAYRSGFWLSHETGRTAVMGLGIYGQMLYVDPEAHVVVGKFATQSKSDDTEAFRIDYALCKSLVACISTGT